MHKMASSQSAQSEQAQLSKHSPGREKLSPISYLWGVGWIMFLILPSLETKTCFLIITDNVRGQTIILNVFLNIVIVCCLKFEVNNVFVLISNPPLTPVLQFCRLLCGLFCVRLFGWFKCFFSQFKCCSIAFICIIIATLFRPNAF